MKNPSVQNLLNKILHLIHHQFAVVDRDSELIYWNTMASSMVPILAVEACHIFPFDHSSIFNVDEYLECCKNRKYGVNDVRNSLILCPRHHRCFDNVFSKSEKLSQDAFTIVLKDAIYYIATIKNTTCKYSGTWR